MKLNRIAVGLSSEEKWKREPFLSAPSGISGGEVRVTDADCEISVWSPGGEPPETSLPYSAGVERLRR